MACRFAPLPMTFPCQTSCGNETPVFWENWLRGVGYTGPPLDPPTYYKAHFLMIEAAAAGFGIALTPSILAARLLAHGRLVRPLPYIADVGVEYRLVYADEQVRRRSGVARFTDGLIVGIAAGDAAAVERAQVASRGAEPR